MTDLKDRKNNLDSIKDFYNIARKELLEELIEEIDRLALDVRTVNDYELGKFNGYEAIVDLLKDKLNE